MKVLSIVVFYTVGFLWTWGALNADMEQYGSCNDYRARLGAAAGFALVPPVWVMSPFLTGFYERGWRLTPIPSCEVRR